MTNTIEQMTPLQRKNRRYYEANKERYKTAYRARSSNPEFKKNAAACNKRTKDSVGQRFKVLLRNAAERGLTVGLTLEQFKELTSLRCTYCGEFSRDKSTHTVVKSFTGIDRIDNSRGYETGNCSPCCFMCNKLKGNLELGVWLAHMKKVIAFSG